MTVNAIKDAITELPEKDRTNLANWIYELGYDKWDREMARDFALDGRGEHLAQEIKQEIAEGDARPLEEGLAKRRANRG